MFFFSPSLPAQNELSPVPWPNPGHAASCVLVSLAAESCNRLSLSSMETLAPRTALGSGRDVMHSGNVVSTSLAQPPLERAYRLGSSSEAKGPWRQNAHLSSWIVAIWELGMPLGRGTGYLIWCLVHRRSVSGLEEGRRTDLCHLVQQFLSSSWNLVSILRGLFCLVCSTDDKLAHRTPF